MKKDIDYIVKDGEVLIVDGYTNASKAISCSRSSIHRFVNNDSSNNLKGNNKIFKSLKYHGRD